MSNSPPTGSAAWPALDAANAKARDEAIDWHVKLSAGDATPADRLAHMEWLAASDNNLNAYDGIRETWKQLDIARDTVLQQENAQQQKASSSVSSNATAQGWVAKLAEQCAAQWTALAARQRYAAFGATATVAIAMAATMALLVGTETGPAQLMAATGPAQHFALEDSSTIVLDTASEVSVVFTGDRRYVKLKKGMAFFDVAPDASRPFIVQASGLSARAVGTSFEVAMIGVREWVSVAEGTVMVSLTPQDNPKSAPADTAPVSLSLTAGQRATLNLNDGTLTQEDVTKSTIGVWQNGQLIFQNTPLSDVVSRLNRYSDQVQIVLAGDQVAGLALTGIMIVDAPETVALRLSQMLPIDYDVDGNTITIKGR